MSSSVQSSHTISHLSPPLPAFPHRANATPISSLPLFPLAWHPMRPPLPLLYPLLETAVLGSHHTRVSPPVLSAHTLADAYFIPSFPRLFC